MSVDVETEPPIPTVSTGRPTGVPALSELTPNSDANSVFMSFYTTLHHCRAGGLHHEFGRAIANLGDEVRARVLALMRARIRDPSIVVTEFLCHAVPELSEEDRASMRTALEAVIAKDQLFNCDPQQNEDITRDAAQRSLESMEDSSKTSNAEIETTEIEVQPQHTEPRRPFWKFWK